MMAWFSGAYAPYSMLPQWINVILAVCWLIYTLHIHVTGGTVTVSVTDKYRQLKSGYELYTMEFLPCGHFAVDKPGKFEVTCQDPPIGRAVYFNLFSYFGLDSLVACEIYAEGNRKYYVNTYTCTWDVMNP